jgi:hypothetical protein
MRRITMALTSVALVALAGCSSTKDAGITAGSATTVAGSAATEAPAGKEWTEVATLSGTAEKQGDDFHLNGGQARIRYSVDEGGFWAFYLLDAGDSLDKSGGFPVITCTDPCDDQTAIRKDKGDYYLDVKGSGAWTITVEEMR